MVKGIIIAILFGLLTAVAFYFGLTWLVFTLGIIDGIAIHKFWQSSTFYLYDY